MKNFAVVSFEPYKVVEFLDSPVAAMKLCDDLHNKDLKAGIFKRYLVRSNITGKLYTSYGMPLIEL